MPHNLTDVSTFTAPVAAPADGDLDRQATFDPAFQALANRTRYLLDKWKTQRATEILLAQPGYSAGAPEWVVNVPTTPKWVSLVNTAHLYVPLRLFRGDKLDNVKAVVFPGAARATVGNRMQLNIMKRTRSGGSVSGAFLRATAATDDGTSTSQLVTVTPDASPATVADDEDYYLYVVGGNDSAANPDQVIFALSTISGA